MSGTLYGIGVGPGDPELLTLKAINILKRVDVVIAPKTVSKGNSLALTIARPHLGANTEVLELLFPMVYNQTTLIEARENCCTQILALLRQDKDVAFLTLGDPMLYSTYIYILKLLREHQIKIETVPGITSFCAAASRIAYPLAEGDEIITIIPVTCDSEKLNRALAASDTAVLMKVSSAIERTVDSLQSNQMAGQAVLISKCGHHDETISYNISDWTAAKPHYLSTIIAKKESSGE